MQHVNSFSATISSSRGRVFITVTPGWYRPLVVEYFYHSSRGPTPEVLFKREEIHLLSLKRASDSSQEVTTVPVHEDDTPGLMKTSEVQEVKETIRSSISNFLNIDTREEPWSIFYGKIQNAITDWATLYYNIADVPIRS